MTIEFNSNFMLGLAVLVHDLAFRLHVLQKGGWGGGGEGVYNDHTVI